MKKIICISLLLFVGCSSVHYTETDREGVKKEFKYSRVGKQELNGFKFEGREDGTKKVELKGNKAEAGELVGLIKEILELAKNAK